MFIRFDVNPVYDFLLDRGFVYTVRHWPAEKHSHNNFTHPVNHKNKLTGQFVQVKTIEPFIVNGQVFPYVLDEFFEYSGFKSSLDWLNAIHKKPDMWLLKAVLVPGWVA